MNRALPKNYLRIPQDLWEALLCDPVLAAWVFFGVELDAFQAARLRYYWWVQNVIDSSGVSSGKTIVLWLFCQLRAILIADQQLAAYYPVFGNGQREFWQYFRFFMITRPAPIWKSQLGDPLKMEAGDEVDGDGTTHGASCWTAFYRNGSQLKLPAPSFMKDAVTQGSLRLNCLLIDEWTHVDASSDGINKQLIDRTTRPCWNQFHPIWGNHIIYSAHAQTRTHPSHARYNSHQRKVNAGDPTFANIAYSYKDYSDRKCWTGKSFKDEYRIESTIQNKRNTCTASEWMGQGFGIWTVSGDGWFTEDLIVRAMTRGKERGLVPVLSRNEWNEVFGVERN